jgi:putative GTP pyrophosphokinase
MGWPTLAYTKNEVKKAGTVLRLHATEVLAVTEDEVAWAKTVARNWRQVHSEAENWAQMGARSRLHTLHVEGSVTQRLKELPTIQRKLVREHPRVQLSTMEDIAGARAVVPTIDDLRRLEDRWTSTVPVQIVRHRDYIEAPPASGYRAVHLVLRHASERLVELQIRTVLQNRWAQLVEELGHRLGVALKNGEGPPETLALLAELAADLSVPQGRPQYAEGHAAAAELLAAFRARMLG